MSQNMNLKKAKSIDSIAIYANDVGLKKIDNVILTTERSNPKLVALFSTKLFTEILKQLQVKKEIFNIYLVNLQAMEDDYKKDPEILRRKLTSDEREYKNTLIAALASTTGLIAKLNIKIKEIQEKVGISYE